MGVSLADNDDDDDFGETHEINVTPFIDVILVLLIIFCRRRARRRRRSRTSRPISASSPI